MKARKKKLKYFFQCFLGLANVWEPKSSKARESECKKYVTGTQPPNPLIHAWKVRCIQLVANSTFDAKLKLNRQLRLNTFYARRPFDPSDCDSRLFISDNHFLSAGLWIYQSVFILLSHWWSLLLEITDNITIFYYYYYCQVTCVTHGVYFNLQPFISLSALPINLLLIILLITLSVVPASNSCETCSL